MNTTQADPIELLLADMIPIPGGDFTMGSSLDEVEACVAYWSRRLIDAVYTRELFREWILKEYPCHPVRVSAFWIGKYPLTNAQYAAFVQDTGVPAAPSITAGEAWDHPVWGVTLADVQQFLAWLNRETAGQLQFRLPSEAEWEYVARDQRRLNYPFGMEFDARCCNTLESGRGGTTPVDAYEDCATHWGVCDLAGNVEELVGTSYAPYPGGTLIVDDLVSALGPDYPVTRGGSCRLGGDLARSARRHGPFPGERFRYIGFRVAADASWQASS